MQKQIVSFIKAKIVSLEDAYCQNYVAGQELTAKKEPTAKDKSDLDATVFNMNKALEKITWYKELLKKESKKIK